MTATLNPPQGAVARIDLGERLMDYASALTHYLTVPVGVIDRIIIADNSFAGIEHLRDVATKMAHDKIVEIMSFSANDHAVALGKAYGEFKLIDIATAASRLMEPDDLVWKVTGRLKVLNLAEMHRAVVRRSPDIACDLHNIPWVGTGRWHGNQRMDLRVFACRLPAYERVYRGLWDQVSPFDEAAMYRATLAAQERFRVMPRFPREPRIEGVSGRHLRNYSAPGQRAKALIRSAFRVAAPFLWI